LTTILKLGGELLEDAGAMRTAARGIAQLRAEGPLAVVHGGGRAIDADLRARGAEPRFVDGLRITDETTLNTVVGVLAGRINTSFVAALCSEGVRAVGLTGADASLGLSAKAPAFTSSSGVPVDLGLVGVPEPAASMRLISDLLNAGYLPVVASIGVSAEGDLLNVNADVLASHVAVRTGATRLIIAGSTPGVFDRSGQPCPALDDRAAQALVAAGTARDGMVTKLRTALDALAAGVSDVRIVDGRSGGYATAPGTLIGRSTDLQDGRSAGLQACQQSPLSISK
jgi:acetylglutamate kinase